MYCYQLCHCFCITLNSLFAQNLVYIITCRLYNVDSCAFILSIVLLHSSLCIYSTSCTPNVNYCISCLESKHLPKSDSLYSVCILGQNLIVILNSLTHNKTISLTCFDKLWLKTKSLWHSWTIIYHHLTMPLFVLPCILFHRSHILFVYPGFCQSGQPDTDSLIHSALLMMGGPSLAPLSFINHCYDLVWTLISVIHQTTRISQG